MKPLFIQSALILCAVLLILPGCRKSKVIVERSYQETLLQDKWKELFVYSVFNVHFLVKNSYYFNNIFPGFPVENNMGLNS
jgi:hypothetical protein